MMPSSGSAPGNTGGTTVPALINQSGIGDILVTAGYRLVDNTTTGLQIVLAARVRVPSASAARALGTGNADVGGVATVRKTCARGWLFGEGGYVKLGDPQGLDLREAMLWGIGGGLQIVPRLFLIESAYGNSSTLPRTAAPAEFGAGLGITLRQRISLTIVPVVGLSNSSPKYGLTIGVTTNLRQR